jgi:hypothetical protein
MAAISNGEIPEEELGVSEQDEARQAAPSGVPQDAPEAGVTP